MHESLSQPRIVRDIQCIKSGEHIHAIILSDDLPLTSVIAEQPMRLTSNQRSDKSWYQSAPDLHIDKSKIVTTHHARYLKRLQYMYVLQVGVFVVKN